MPDREMRLITYNGRVWNLAPTGSERSYQFDYTKIYKFYNIKTQFDFFNNSDKMMKRGICSEGVREDGFLKRACMAEGGSHCAYTPLKLS